MSDCDSVIFLSDSDNEEDVKEVPRDGFDYDDVEEDEEREEKEKYDDKEIQLTERRGVDETGGIILQAESFFNDKTTQDQSKSNAKQDMTTQTDDFPLNQSKNSSEDSRGNLEVSSSGNKNAALTVSKETSTTCSATEDAERRSSTEDHRSCISSDRPYQNYSNVNNGRYQNNTNVNNGPPMRYHMQRTRSQTRMCGNLRVQPYNRSNVCGPQNGVQPSHNHNFVNNYNRFGVPTPQHNFFARQNLSVRERYIEQFKEHLRLSFANFLNNVLPYNFPQSNNNNFSQGNNSSYPLGNNNFSQGNGNINYNRNN